MKERWLVLVWTWRGTGWNPFIDHSGPYFADTKSEAQEIAQRFQAAHDANPNFWTTGPYTVTRIEWPDAPPGEKEKLMSTVKAIGPDENRTTEQKPSVGRIVHYQAYGTTGGEFASLPRAAIITAVHAETDAVVAAGAVTVCVLNPSGIFFNRVVYSAEPKAGCWNWPPRV